MVRVVRAVNPDVVQDLARRRALPPLAPRLAAHALVRGRVRLPERVLALLLDRPALGGRPRRGVAVPDAVLVDPRGARLGRYPAAVERERAGGEPPLAAGAERVGVAEHAVLRGVHGARAELHRGDVRAREDCRGLESAAGRAAAVHASLGPGEDGEVDDALHVVQVRVERIQVLFGRRGRGSDVDWFAFLLLRRLGRVRRSRGRCGCRMERDIWRWNWRRRVHSKRFSP